MRETKNLTVAERKAVVDAYSIQGISGVKLAEQYGVRINTIYRVLHGEGVLKRRAWKNDELGVRVCGRCKTEKPLAAFAKCSTRPDWGGYDYTCRACVNQRQRERGYSLKNNTGLSVEQYDALLEKQGGGCAICGTPPKRMRLSVDHDHETGMIRGLLCHGCNTKMVGRDDAVWSTKAATYADSPPSAGALAYRKKRFGGP